MLHRIKPLLRWFWQFVVLVFCGLPGFAGSQDKVRPGAPTLHLRYPENNVSAFYNEITINHSATRSYFAVTGWHNGYFGIQEVANGKRQLLFSVWDSLHNDPSTTELEKRVTVVYKDETVRIGRFGNEGSGGQSFFPYNWQTGVKYAFLVKTRQVGDRAEYSGYFRAPDMKDWKHLVTFSTLHAATDMKGLYSFVEDFARTPESATHLRQALFSNAWVRTTKGELKPIVRVKVTSYPKRATELHAQSSAGGFLLSTGADTQDTSNSLGTFLQAQPTGPLVPPEGL